MKEVAFIAKSVGIDLGDLAFQEGPEESSSDDRLEKDGGSPQVLRPNIYSLIL